MVTKKIYFLIKRIRCFVRPKCLHRNRSDDECFFEFEKEKKCIFGSCSGIWMPLTSGKVENKAERPGVQRDPRKYREIWSVHNLLREREIASEVSRQTHGVHFRVIQIWSRQMQR